MGLVVLDELPMPELEPVDGAAGLVVLDELPVPELDEPEPALPVDGVVVDELLLSRRQVSRWVPVRPTHLLASLPDAPDAAPVLLVSDEVEDEPLADGAVVLLLPDDDGEVVLLPEDELPAAGEVVLLPDEPMPVLPLLEPEDCANAAPDRARSAAAVAAVSVFNIMREISFEGLVNAAGVTHARVMPFARRKFFRAAGMAAFVQAANRASPRT